MTKYIDADALKRWIQTECNPYGAPTLDYASSVKIMERIDEMPAADVEPVRKWIPCSERLPEDRKRVLICYESGAEDIAWAGLQYLICRRDRRGKQYGWKDKSGYPQND